MALEISESNFAKEVLESDKPVLVDFWAPWCGPCKMLTPVIEELAGEYEGKVKVGKLNTDENIEIASKFQITSIPCLILFKGGTPVQKIVGFRPKNDIKKIIEENI
ncbi:thioredoxin [Endomicrobium proavitum]|uniref:Thioredoxin n=1 Tax=Endomicrobium proavitum TaxID=1408281 RepID=A0A0G3WHE8_9BACT|nr:thioredoxin [Endomicrobium proavitum]AKL98051.1 thioredoxin 1 [Endomicrobium proavitum]